MVWFGFVGAAVAAVVVAGVAGVGRRGSPGRSATSPSTLALAGTAIMAGLASVTTAILVTDPDAFDVTEELVEAVFGMPARVIPDPVSGTPLVVPVGRHRVSPPAARPAPDPVEAPGSIPGEAGLRAIVDEPHHRAVDKVADHVDPVAAEFLAAARLVVLASGHGDALDVSPRGDAAGFVRVLDDGRRLALPERAGNRRLDTQRNLLARPGIALLFLVPGVTHALRVAGRARVTDDDAVLGLWEDRPPLALVVDVQESFVHCSAALTRSQVWAGTPAPQVPGIAELYVAARDAPKQG